MTAEQLYYQFCGVIKRHFPKVLFKYVETRPHNRYSLYVPNGHRDKRWMQAETHPDSLQVAMDHLRGEITREHLSILGLAYGRDGTRTGVIMADKADAVFLTVMETEPVDFESEVWIDFLNKHYASYLRRVGL